MANSYKDSYTVRTKAEEFEENCFSAALFFENAGGYELQFESVLL